MALDRSLKTVVRAALEPFGFKSNRSGSVYTRVQGGVHQMLGLRKSRTGGDDYAIYCQCGTSAEEPDISFELSPVAPLKNTYWWPALLTDQELGQLTHQFEQVALPFFAIDHAKFDAQQ